MNAALVVKISDQNWEVIAKYNLPSKKLDEFLNAYESSNLITGLNTTSYKESAVPGATWDGTLFSGGVKPAWIQEDTDWSLISTYSLISNNKILIVLNTVKNDVSDEKMKAAFSSDVTMVPITLENIPKLGSTWNGTEFLTGV